MWMDVSERDSGYLWLLIMNILSFRCPLWSATAGIGGGLVQPGNSLKLSCPTQGVTFSKLWRTQFASLQGMGWSGLLKFNLNLLIMQHIMRVSLKEGFTISGDDSKRRIYLQMNWLREEHTATYYCTSHNEVQSMWTQKKKIFLE